MARKMSKAEEWRRKVTAQIHAAEGRPPYVPPFARGELSGPTKHPPTGAKFFAIRARDDLGAMPADLERQHLAAADVAKWLDEHEDVGTFKIVNEATGREVKPARF